MKLSLIALVLVGAAATCGLAARSAFADKPYSLYQVVCLPVFDLVELRLLGFFGERRFSLERENKSLRESYGIFEPRWYAPAKRAFDVSGSASEVRRMECPLPSGTVELAVRSVPIGRADFTLTVTVEVDHRTIVDELCFSCCALCDNDSEIERLSYDGRARSVTLYGDFLRQRQNSPVSGPIHDDIRRFLVETDGIRAADPESIGWTTRRGAITSHDIPVADWESGE